MTASTLQQMRASGDKIAMVSCYDASFAALCEASGIEAILVGDSLGMVVQGHETTLPVSMDEMVYHTRCVARGTKQTLVMGDLPFASYQASAQEAYANSARLMAAGASMVKLEGGALLADTVAFLVERGIPVCGHIGLTPQSVHQLGGYKVQGKTGEAGARLLADAEQLARAGAAALVIECVPAELGKALTEAVGIPTIGIGAGPHTSGQILILHDMLDVYPGKKARFVKNFMAGAGSIQQAVRDYVREVKAETFPAPEHCF
jgi:3-methyl-2-oxobutanoate hydroxymethyltransferase